MALLDVLSEARTALVELGYDVEVRNFLEIDSQGLLSIPEAQQFVIHPLTNTDDYAWGHLKQEDALLQVNAFAESFDDALVMWQAAKDTLIPLKYIPVRGIDLGRNETHAGWGQVFRKGHE
jgi:hypothetical protein